MVDIERQIQVVIDVVTRGEENIRKIKEEFGKIAPLTKAQSKSAKAASASMNKMYAALKNVSFGQEQINITQKEQGKVLETIRERWRPVEKITLNQIKRLRKQGVAFKDINKMVRKSGEEYKGYYTGLMRVGKQITKSTRAHEHFKMHLLSIMFFGMAVSRVFRKWSNTLFELTGVTDAFNAMQQVVMANLIPFGMTINDILFDVMDLDEGFQKMIATGALTGDAFGRIMSGVGQMGLGFQGLRMTMQNFLHTARAGLSATGLGGVADVFLEALGAVTSLDEETASTVLSTGLLSAATTALGDLIYNINQQAEEGAGSFEALSGAFKQVAKDIFGVLGVLTKAGMPQTIMMGIGRELISQLANTFSSDLGPVIASSLDLNAIMIDAAADSGEAGANSLMDSLVDQLNSSKTWLEQQMQNVMDEATNLYVSIKEGNFEAIKEQIANWAWDTIDVSWNLPLPTIGFSASDIVDAIRSIPGWNKITFGVLGEDIGGWIGDNIDAGISLVSGLGALISGVIEGIIEGQNMAFVGLGRYIGSIMGSNISEGIRKVSNIGSNIIRILHNKIYNIKGDVENIGNDLIGKVLGSGAIKGFIDKGKRMADFFTLTLGDVMHDIKPSVIDFGKRGIGKILSFAVGDGFYNERETMYNDINSTIRGINVSTDWATSSGAEAAEAYQSSFDNSMGGWTPLTPSGGSTSSSLAKYTKGSEKGYGGAEWFAYQALKTMAPISEKQKEALYNLDNAFEDLKSTMILSNDILIPALNNIPSRLKDIKSAVDETGYLYSTEREDIKTYLTQVKNAIENNTSITPESLSNMEGILKEAINVLENVSAGRYGWSQEAESEILSPIEGLKKMFKDIEGYLENINAPMAKYQHGGYVPETGPALLHAGETVLPSGFSPVTNITINATISSDMDIRRVGSQLGEIWASEQRRLLMR